MNLTPTVRHSPGTWRLSAEGASVLAPAVNGGTCQVAECWHHPTDRPMCRTKEEARANARLIAAAPDMLRVLRTILAPAPGRGPSTLTGDILAQAQAVIHKALHGGPA